MGIQKVFCKAFVGGQWLVAYRDLQKNTGYQYAQENLPEGQWVADPFLLEHKGKHYLFCEQYETQKNKAGIGYFLFEDGIPINKGIVLQKPYHMSYPCLFTYKDVVYMIPETAVNQTVELYRATDFPEKWELDAVLVENVRYMDSTVFENEDGWHLFAYENRGKTWALIDFALNMEEKSLQKCSEKIYKTNVGRPAGNLWRENGKRYRPAQDCTEKYGKALLVYEEENGQECLVKKIGAEEIGLNAQRIHTMNRNSRYEVVDLFRERFDLLHGWKIFKRSVLKK